MYHYITVPEQEIFDEATNMFISVKEQQLRLIHSLVSVHKWEMKWKKPFMEAFSRKNSDKLTREEILSYVECMTLTPNVDPAVYLLLTPADIEGVFKYVEDPMTATTITNRDPNQNNGKHRVITAEVIYAWMFLGGIPKECEKWHLNTLMMLIRVVNIEGNPNKKKMSKAQTMANHRAALARARGKK